MEQSEAVVPHRKQTDPDGDPADLLPAPAPPPGLNMEP